MRETTMKGNKKIFLYSGIIVIFLFVLGIFSIRKIDVYSNKYELENDEVLNHDLSGFTMGVKLENQISLNIFQSTIFYYRIRKILKNSNMSSETEHLKIDLSFLDNQNYDRHEDKEIVIVPLSTVVLNPKYTLCVYYLFTKKEEIQIGDSDYIKYDNQYYFVGQDITDCIIKKIDDYILVK